MARCHIFPVPNAPGRPSYLHETGGIPGNWALDYMCPPGSLVLAPTRLKITRLSGHSPTQGELPGAVFGYSLYGVDEEGFTFFFTHLARRYVKVGQWYCPGATLARVGQWPKDKPRTHLHMGITGPTKAVSQGRSKAIAQKARKLKPA